MKGWGYCAIGFAVWRPKRRLLGHFFWQETDFERTSPRLFNHSYSFFWAFQISNFLIRKALSYHRQLIKPLKFGIWNSISSSSIFYLVVSIRKKKLFLLLLIALGIWRSIVLIFSNVMSLTLIMKKLKKKSKKMKTKYLIKLVLHYFQNTLWINCRSFVHFCQSNEW